MLKNSIQKSLYLFKKNSVLNDFSNKIMFIQNCPKWPSKVKLGVKNKFLYFIAYVLLIDRLKFLAWALSGQ